MTNKEKYFDKASPNELTEMLANKNLCKIMICEFANSSHINCAHCDACNRKDKFEKWLSQEAEQTADEMFEELGYERPVYNGLRGKLFYCNKFDKDVVIIIYWRTHCFKKHGKFYISQPITEEENVAINKKISEMEGVKKMAYLKEKFDSLKHDMECVLKINEKGKVPTEDLQRTRRNIIDKCSAIIEEVKNDI